MTVFTVGLPWTRTAVAGSSLCSEDQEIEPRERGRQHLRSSYSETLQAFPLRGENSLKLKKKNNQQPSTGFVSLNSETEATRQASVLDSFTLAQARVFVEEEIAAEKVLR